MKKRLAIVVAAAAATALLPMGGAQAANHTVAANNSFGYNPSALVITAGDSLTFQNNHGIVHNVTSRQRSGGVAVFSSGTISFGSTPVNRVETTPPGAYPFYCTIHPQMNAVLVIAPAA